jgi:hypothetical protein
VAQARHSHPFVLPQTMLLASHLGFEFDLCLSLLTLSVILANLSVVILLSMKGQLHRIAV